MLIWKLYLSNLDQWKITITGSHVPIDSKVNWTLPTGTKGRLDEDTRDLILKFSDKATSHEEIKQIISQKPSLAGREVPSYKRISRFVLNKKKRSLRRNQNVRECLEQEKQVEETISTEIDSTFLSDKNENIDTNEMSDTSDANMDFQDIQTVIPSNTIVQLPLSDEAGGSGSFVMYYDSANMGSAIGNTMQDLNPSAIQTVCDPSVANMIFNDGNIKMENQPMPVGILDQSVNQVAFPITTEDRQQISGQDLSGIFTLPVSQLQQDVSGNMVSSIVAGPQQMIMPSHMNQLPLPVLGIDAEGQPWGFNDMNAFLRAYQTQQQQQTQTIDQRPLDHHQQLEGQQQTNQQMELQQQPQQQEHMCDEQQLNNH